MNYAPRFIAGGTIKPCSIVKHSTTADFTVLQCGANEAGIGVAYEGMEGTPGLPGSDIAIHATAPNSVQVYGWGDVALLVAGSGGVTAGDYIESDASGYGVTSAGDNRNVIGKALTSAPAGAKFHVWIFPMCGVTIGTTSALSVSGTLALSGDISPSALAANTDNWAPTDIATCSTIRASASGADRNLTGMTSGSDGRIVVLMNVGSTYNIILVHDSTSTAANRFLCPNGANFYIPPYSMVVCQYDSTSSRWRVHCGNPHRSGLLTDVGAEYTIPLASFQIAGTGAQLGATAGTPSGALGLTIGTHGSATPKLVGEAASNNSKTNTGRVQFTLPPEYVAGQAITVRVRARITGNVEVAQTVAVSAFKADDAAGVGSELCATSAATVTASFANYDFTITPTGLTAGHTLDLLVTGVANDTGGAANKFIEIARVAALLNIKG